MSYVEYKEVTKSFNFSKALKEEDLPGYIKHYVLDDENILVAYKTSRDHGVFTDKKIVLFDNVTNVKQIHIIPYQSISIMDIVFDSDSAELDLYLNCAYPVKLKFVEMSVDDKVRLRLLYTCINRIVNGQKLVKEEVKRLQSCNVSLRKK